MVIIIACPSRVARKIQNNKFEEKYINYQAPNTQGVKIKCNKNDW